MNDDRMSHAPFLSADLAFGLETLVRVVERQSREFRASVLLLGDDGRLIDAAAPSLPDAYRRSIHGLEIGPSAGSCGTAAFTKERVVVSDIGSDPLWEGYRDLALPHGLVACWSQPIIGSDGRVLGTFAMYYPEPRSPTSEELEIIDAAARRAAVMLESSMRGAEREELVSGLV